METIAKRYATTLNALRTTTGNASQVYADLVSGKLTGHSDGTGKNPLITKTRDHLKTVFFVDGSILTVIDFTLSFKNGNYSFPYVFKYQDKLV